MNTSARWKSISLCTFVFICGLLLIDITACGGATPIPSTITPAPSPQFPTETAVPTYAIISTATAACIDGLSFLADATIPDFSIVAPGSVLEKQWLVQNSGSCNWDERYRLRLVSGELLGASPEQALYPAHAGSQATLQIIFAAPTDPGTYTSEWQAFDPNGIPFGDSFFIKITVQQ